EASLTQTSDPTVDRAHGCTEAPGEVGDAVLSLRVDQQGGQDLGLQPRPEDGQQRRRRASHNPKITSIYPKYQVESLDPQPSLHSAEAQLAQTIVLCLVRPFLREPDSGANARSTAATHRHGKRRLQQVKPISDDMQRSSAMRPVRLKSGRSAVRSRP